MKYNFLTYIVLLFVLVFSSCNKDDGDTQKPEILLAEPFDGQVLLAGDTLHFEVEFLDNIELKSYKIDIHPNEDSHDHKSTLDEGEWSFQKSWEFEPGLKNTSVHHDEIVIPTLIDGVAIHTGDYHFLVYCTDKAGNESWIDVDIEIELP